jgi:hypothetical protein
MEKSRFNDAVPAVISARRSPGIMKMVGGERVELPTSSV